MAIFTSTMAQNVESQQEKTVTWNLENYNDWNLPFSKTIELQSNNNTFNFPKSNYILELDPSAYFSVVFTDLDIERAGNPIFLNYTFYGEKNFQANGTWIDMKLTFDKTADPTDKNSYGDYNLTLRMFLAYSKPPESGL